VVHRCGNFVWRKKKGEGNFNRQEKKEKDLVMPGIRGASTREREKRGNGPASSEKEKKGLTEG